MTSLRPIRSTRPPPSSPYFYRNWPCGSNRPAAVKSAAIMAANPALSTLRSRGCFRLPMLRSGRLALMPARVPPDPQWDTPRCFSRNSLGQSAGIIEGRNTSAPAPDHLPFAILCQRQVFPAPSPACVSLHPSGDLRQCRNSHSLPHSPTVRKESTGVFRFIVVCAPHPKHRWRGATSHRRIHTLRRHDGSLACPLV